MSEEITFGGWLKQQRKGRGVGIDELAEQIGCSPVTLLKIEASQRRPSRQIALLLASCFRIPPDEREAFVAFARAGRNVAGDVISTAPWRKALVGQTNLPALLTPLIGRQQEETAALDHLLNSTTRLLTLVGPPGIGKTRLALQLGARLIDHFEDGVFFVELAPVVDPELVLPTVARALGLHEGGELHVESLLLDYVRQRRMLLVLDNFEQILDASIAVVRLLQASPWLKVLITSREALHVRGERRFLVPPLAVPELRHLPSLEELATYPSVELFVDRAQAVAPDFKLTEINAADVAAACVGLEGLPLAIELAAARANRLSPADMRRALTSRLKLLAAETRDLPARQRTLRGAIKWSYDLLSEEEQDLFRRLGVFVGGFTSEAVEAVCSEGYDHLGAAPIVDTLYSLVERNLVRQDNLGSGAGASSGTPRFGLWEAIREFALERLEEREELEDTRRRHALYFMELAEGSEAELSGADQVLWLDRLEAEHDNLLAALRWSVACSPEVGLRLAGALKHFWWMRGYFSEGRDWLAAALAASPSPPPSLPPSPSSASSLASQSISSEPELTQRYMYRAKALYGAGTFASEQADYSAARASYEEGLAICRALSVNRAIASFLGGLGVVASEQGDFAGARPYHEESLAIYREIGHRWGIANSLSNLALVAQTQGEYDTARSLHEEGLVIWRELGEKFRIALALDSLGILNLVKGHYAEARTLFEKSLAIRRELGHRWGIAASLAHLADLAYLEGDYARAQLLYKESLTIQREIGNKKGIAWGLAGLGGVAAAVGDPTPGAKLLGAVTALWESLSVSPDEDDRRVYQRGVASARAHLGEQAFQRAWAEGLGMTMEEAIEYALHPQ